MGTRLPSRVSFAALITLVAGLSASVLWSSRLSDDERAEDTRRLERAADIRRTVFQHELDEAAGALLSVNQLSVTVGPVSDAQFRRFTRPLLRQYPQVQAFAFLRVLARKPAPPGDEAGTQGISSRTPEHNRPGYIEPARGGESILGVAAPFAAHLNHAIDAATVTGRMAASGLFHPAQEGSRGPGFVAIMPVYRPGAVPVDAAARRNAIAGHTLAVFQVGQLVESTLGRAGLLDQKFALHLYAGSRPAERSLAYRHAPGQQAQSPDPLPGPRTLTVAHTFEAAGMQWHMVVSTPSGALGRLYPGAWLVLVAGSVMTLLAAGCLQSLAGRATGLARANARLNADIAARERMERALRESEERFRRLADLSSDWYWEQDAELRLSGISSDEVLGYPAAQLIGKALPDLPFEAAAADLAAYQALAQARQPFPDIEFKVRQENGHTRWIAARGEPLFDMRGNFTGYRGTAKDITARKETELALRRSQQELRELSAHQERVKEDERKRIAREIHDDLGQNLLALRIDVSMLDEATAAKAPEINGKIRAVLAQIDNTMKSVRGIINNLRPSVLDLGLQAAIEWQVQQFRSRSGIPCSLIIEQDGFDALLDEESATSVFRIVQESLTNISRHAQASHAGITVRRAGAMLVITIGDDGIGAFASGQRKPRSFGLIGIRERVRQMGGEFTVDSHAGGGTRLTFSIPIRAAHAAAAA